MPAFNEQAVIARSLRSLLALDYPADKLELVAVNDGSTDEHARARWPRWPTRSRASA